LIAEAIPKKARNYHCPCAKFAVAVNQIQKQEIYE